MTEKRFDELIEHSLKRIKDVLIVKGREYRRNKDPFHNFNVGTRQSTTNESREEVIWGMARKHFISIQDIRKDVKENILPDEEILNEKYIDLIIYLLIEKASIHEKIDNSYNNLST